jgi:hypothetical protein
MLHRRNPIATILAALLCGSGCSQLAQQTVPAAPGSVWQASQLFSGKGPLLFVGGSELSEYQLGNSKALRSVKLHSIASAIALDPLRHQPSTMIHTPIRQTVRRCIC